MLVYTIESVLSPQGFFLLFIFGEAICSQQGVRASKILLLMTLNGVIIQMKGNYPNLNLPSALQYLWVLFISCSTHCSHFNILGYSSYSPLDSTCTLLLPLFLFLVMFSCLHHLNRFMPSLPFISPSPSIFSHVKTHSQYFPTSFSLIFFFAFFYFFLFASSSMFSTHKGATNWAQLYKKTLQMGTLLLIYPFLFWDQCQLWLL